MCKCTWHLYMYMCDVSQEKLVYMIVPNFIVIRHSHIHTFTHYTHTQHTLHLSPVNLLSSPIKQILVSSSTCHYPSTNSSIYPVQNGGQSTHQISWPPKSLSLKGECGRGHRNLIYWHRYNVFCCACMLCASCIICMYMYTK